MNRQLAGISLVSATCLTILFACPPPPTRSAFLTVSVSTSDQTPEACLLEALHRATGQPAAERDGPVCAASRTFKTSRPFAETCISKARVGPLQVFIQVPVNAPSSHELRSARKELADVLDQVAASCSVKVEAEECVWTNGSERKECPSLDPVR